MYTTNALHKTVACIALFFIFSLSLAQTETRNNGLITLKTKTALGSIYTYLPENYVAGKPISGSFFLEAAGNSTKDVQKNIKKLVEHSLKIGNSNININIKDKVFSIVLNSNQVNVSILDAKGKILQSFKPKFSAKIASANFSFPRGVKSEDRSQVIGNFDGDIKNTSLQLGGQLCEVLAESPIQILFKAPKLDTGIHDFKVKENNKEVANGKTQLVNYELTAGQLNLKRGQSTHIQANITGLNFLEKPIPLTVTNLTPAVVSLEGGNSQTIMISRQVGSFIKRWNVRSIKTGSFSIFTELKLPDTEFPNEGVAISSDFDEKDPCKELKKSCDELLAHLNAKKADAKAANDIADADKKEADKLKKVADDLEKKAKKAENDAIPSDEGATITYEGYTYKMIDHKLLNVLRDEAYTDYKDGNSNVNEYQDRLKELNGPEALKEMEKKRKELEEKLKEKAKEDRETADKAKEPYNKAKAKADASKKIADERQAEVDVAQKAYDECMKKVKDECDKIKADIAKAEAERIKKEKEAIASAAEAEGIKIAEEKKKAELAERKKKALEHQKYLLDNIKELGLLGSAGIKEVPGIWDWLPDFLENPVGNFVEDRAGGVIPTDVFKAIGGLYNVVLIFYDPCNLQRGYLKTIERLQKMTNPYTNKKYTEKEAERKTVQMCKLLQKLKAKSLQLKKVIGN